MSLLSEILAAVKSTPGGVCGAPTVVSRETDGSLFLVRTRGPNTEVRQVGRDLSGLSATDDTWRDLSKDEPAVREFVGETEMKK